MWILYEFPNVCMCAFLFLSLYQRMREFICSDDFNGNVKNDVCVMYIEIDRNIIYNTAIVYYNVGTQFIHKPNTDAIAYGIHLL